MMTDALRTRLLLAWKDAIERDPFVARQAGPPSWLVKEQQRKGETLHEANQRLRREYGLDVVTKAVTESRVTTETAVTQEVVTEDAVTERKVCEDCGKPILTRSLCGACRVKRTRARKAS